MAFALVGELVSKAFSDNLPEGKLEDALKWSVHQQFIPLRGSRDDVMYLHTAGRKAYEPNPSSTAQLRLDYKLTQICFSISWDKAAELASKSMRGGLEQFSDVGEWGEELVLGSGGCFEHDVLLRYARKHRYNPFSLSKGQFFLNDSGGTLHTFDGEFSYSISDAKRRPIPSCWERLEGDLGAMRGILTQPEKVVDEFVKRWKAGYRD